MSFTSPFPDVVLPTGSVYDYLFGDLTAEDSGRTALVDAASGAETSYGDLVRRIDAFAGGLAARGIGVGDVVALLAPNSSDFAIAFHGILRAGATATTVNALFTARDITKQLKDSKARLLVTVNALGPQALEGALAAGLTEHQVVLLDGAGLGAEGRAPDVSFDPATHLAALPYSSGTTANPKGVMLTHANLTANVAQIRPLQGMTADDRLLAVLPFFHIYGMTVLLNAALHARARLVIMPSFDLGEFLGNIATHRCTFVYIAPPVAVALAKHPLVDSYDLSSLRAVLSGAASLDADLGRAVSERLGCTVSQGYGMSELSPVSHITPHDGGLATVGTIAPLDSCGWTVPNGVSKLVDPDTGDEIGIPAEGVSATGELWFKGPNVMAGYLNNEAATQETIDADGFLHTGDLAQVDSNGCVYVVDRLKELIKYKGYQVPPAELESVLLGHPGIADAAVIGVQDSQSGEEVPKAFVVKQPSAELSADEVIAFVAGLVAPYKKVRQVEFIDTIPKSSAGKILRRELRDR
ncbi:AMP-dependent synthetase [Mycobacterium sp. GA-1841]|uniref:4-coumarate--CoA ligase family protein n=1 Tax=Mycobacterium sp. GA-1841 TaxID=1834154 RepID=UPI00096DBABA|nr:4-coumarate--CoA ligase family protein [Mycobacterium sp. GA-1841]OMC29674.1 AMP-dependent synthetase [Mycobacterium sp. GA-1841]